MSSKSTYYIYAVLLEGCYYSNAARELLNTHAINKEIKIVTYENKEKYKLENYDTYPQIFFKKTGATESLFLGGYSDLNDFINMFKNKEYNENNITQFQNKYNWSMKAILRFIELINKKSSLV